MPLTRDRRSIFYLDNSLYQKFIQKYPEAELNQKILSDISKQLLTDHLDGKTTTTNKDQTLDEKLKKVKLANETLKAWKDIRSSGGTPDDLDRLVNHGEIPNYENNCETNTENTTTPTANNPPKIELKTFGKTIINKPKKILQEDGTLRCMHCNKKIEMRAYNFEQLDDYKLHVESNHTKLFDSERKELMEIYPN